MCVSTHFLVFLHIYIKYYTSLPETYTRKMLVTIATIVREDKKCFKQASDMFFKMFKDHFFFIYFLFCFSDFYLLYKRNFSLKIIGHLELQQLSCTFGKFTLKIKRKSLEYSVKRK